MKNVWKKNSVWFFLSNSINVNFLQSPMQQRLKWLRFVLAYWIDFDFRFFFTLFRWIHAFLIHFFFCTKSMIWLLATHRFSFEFRLGFIICCSLGLFSVGSWNALVAVDSVECIQCSNATKNDWKNGFDWESLTFYMHAGSIYINLWYIQSSIIISKWFFLLLIFE